MVVVAEGFEYEAQKPSATRVEGQKWGWSGHEPGAFVVLRLNTMLARKDGSQIAGLARVYLGHTCSWQPWGTATVECISGCKCDSAMMNNHWAQKSTQTALMALEVSQHQQCDIKVTIDQPAAANSTATTILHSALVDQAAGAPLDTGVVGQWDLPLH